MKIVEFKDYDNQTTPLSAYNLNRLQQNLITTKYQMTFSSAVSGGSIITLPCYYQVGQDTLDVYLNSELLKKASTKDSEGHYYEVGNSDTKSNQIKITSDWSIASGDVLNLIVRGTTDSYDQNLSPDKATQLADEISAIKEEQTTQNGKISTNADEISAIKEEQTTQNGKISTNADKISANKEEITALQAENSRLKGITNALPKVSEEGTSLTLENTANTPFNNIILNGNTSQNGEPTPATPQEIQSVTGNNKVVVSNKNLLNIEDRTYTTDGISAKVENGTFIINGTPSGSTSFLTFSNITLKAGTYTISANNTLKFTNESDFRITSSNFSAIFARLYLSSENAKLTFTLNEDLVNGNVQLRTGTSITYNNFVIKPQLEQGDTATSYVPHKETIYELDLGNIELCQIGDYQDYFYKKDNKWYKHKAINKNTLNGTERWHFGKTKTNYITLFTSSFQNDIKIPANDNINSNTLIYCDKFSNNTSASQQWENDTMSSVTINAGKNITFNIPNSIATTIDEFKTYLISNNITLYYVLATPIEEEIIDTTLISQLNALYNAYTYNDTTNITQTNANLPFYINAEAFKKIS